MEKKEISLEKNMRIALVYKDINLMVAILIHNSFFFYFAYYWLLSKWASSELIKLNTFKSIHCLI